MVQRMHLRFDKSNAPPPKRVHRAGLTTTKTHLLPVETAKEVSALPPLKPVPPALLFKSDMLSRANNGVPCGVCGKRNRVI